MKQTLEERIEEARKKFKNNPRDFFGLASVADAYRVAIYYIKLLKKQNRALKRENKDLKARLGNFQRDSINNDFIHLCLNDGKGILGRL